MHSPGTNMSCRHDSRFCEPYRSDNTIAKTMPGRIRPAEDSFHAIVRCSAGPRRRFGGFGVLVWRFAGRRSATVPTRRSKPTGQSPSRRRTIGYGPIRAPAPPTASSASVADLAKAATSGSAESREVGDRRLADLGPKAKAAVPQLIEALEGKEPGIRWRAARALAAIGPAAADAASALATALDDPDHHVRSHAAYGSARSARQVRIMSKQSMARITDEDPHVRRAVIRAIDRIHPDPEEVVDSIAAAVERGRSVGAVAAVRSLVAYGERRLPAAIKVLRDAEPKSKARYWACVLLAEFGPAAEAGVEPLTKALTDEDPGIRMQAVLALGQIGPAAKAAVPALD